MGNHQLLSRIDLSGTKSIPSSRLHATHMVTTRLLKLAVGHFHRDDKLMISQQVLTFSGNRHSRSSLAPVVMISLAIIESDGSTSNSVLTFSGNVYSRSSLALGFCTKNNIELKSFTDVVTD